MTAKYQPGDRVRIRIDTPAGQGKVGVVETVHGAFRNPESLAHDGDGLPKQSLYLVRFDQADIWDQYEAAVRDQLLIDIYGHWLEPA